MDMQSISISKAAKILGVSIDTLRRWDASGKFPSVRRPSGHRYYRMEDISSFLHKVEVSKSDLFILASYWASSKDASEPDELFYCPNSSVFLSKITKLQDELGKIAELKSTFPLLVAVAGEIGDNSFAHNIGKWPDIPGIFFGYDISKRQIVLADRGQGILKTLKRVRPSLENDEDALRVAFTEIISGRAPEERGNGLKFVRNVVSGNDIDLYFKTGNAEVKIKKNDKELDIRKSEASINGCIALINF